MRTHLFEASVWLPRPREEVFAFFGNCRNLDVLTPPWLHFQVLTPETVEMRPGLLIDYRLRLHGIPIRWQSEITVWDPPRRFVDEQRRGPYRRWVHEHRFACEAGGTRAEDRVEYAVPGGPLAPWIHRRFLLSDVLKIFEYRARKLLELFGRREEGGMGDV
jgi:ligand-binding SRPBCC domain-containing protein